MRRMLAGHEDVFYYVTLMNENYAQPSMPEGAREGIIRGMYKIRDARSEARVRLLGAGRRRLDRAAGCRAPSRRAGGRRLVGRSGPGHVRRGGAETLLAGLPRRAQPARALGSIAQRPPRQARRRHARASRTSSPRRTRLGRKQPGSTAISAGEHVFDAGWVQCKSTCNYLDHLLSSPSTLG